MARYREGDRRSDVRGDVTTVRRVDVAARPVHRASGHVGRCRMAAAMAVNRHGPRRAIRMARFSQHVGVAKALLGLALGVGADELGREAARNDGETARVRAVSITSSALFRARVGTCSWASNGHSAVKVATSEDNCSQKISTSHVHHGTATYAGHAFGKALTASCWDVFWERPTKKKKGRITDRPASGESGRGASICRRASRRTGRMAWPRAR